MTTITLRMPPEDLARAWDLAHVLSRGQLAPLDRNDVLRAAVRLGFEKLAEQAKQIEATVGVSDSSRDD